MVKCQAAITGVSCWVPEDKLTNADIEKMVETTNEWILERCGISERRILKDPGKGTAYLGEQAASSLLKKMNIDPMTVDLVIVATATPEYQFPATANIIADKIGAKKSWGFDVMAACSGFVFALNTAKQFVENGTHKRVIVIGADKMSSIVDYTNRGNCILFGDGAGAVMLEPDYTGNGMIDSRMYTDGSARELLYQKAGGSLHPASEETVKNREHYIYMSGQPVFKVAVEKMADVAEEIMQRNKLTGDDIAYLVPHQANKRIIDATARRMKVGPEKVMLNIQRYGNTTNATIPICLTEWESKLNTGDNLVLTTFGAGFTWGAIYLKWAYDGRLVTKPGHASILAEA